MAIVHPTVAFKVLSANWGIHLKVQRADSARRTDSGAEVLWIVKVRSQAVQQCWQACVTHVSIYVTRSHKHAVKGIFLEYLSQQYFVVMLRHWWIHFGKYMFEKTLFGCALWTYVLMISNICSYSVCFLLMLKSHESLLSTQPPSPISTQITWPVSVDTIYQTYIQFCSWTQLDDGHKLMHRALNHKWHVWRYKTISKSVNITIMQLCTGDNGLLYLKPRSLIN